MSSRKVDPTITHILLQFQADGDHVRFTDLPTVQVHRQPGRRISGGVILIKSFTNFNVILLKIILSIDGEDPFHVRQAFLQGRFIQHSPIHAQIDGLVKGHHDRIDVLVIRGKAQQIIHQERIRAIQIRAGGNLKGRSWRVGGKRFKRRRGSGFGKRVDLLLFIQRGWDHGTTHR
jgi:hypothetical protein